MTEIKSGVYQIRNIINNKRYVGSTINLYNRWATHKKLLNRGVDHHNRHLQRAWNKYGEDSFVFEVLEYVLQGALSKKEFRPVLLAREQHYKDLYKSYNRKYGYDICKTAGSSLGVKFSAAHKQKLRLAKLGSVLSLAHRANIGKGLKASEAFAAFNKSPKSIKTRKKISETLKGRRLSASHIKKLQDRFKIDPPFKGKRHSEKSKKKMRASHLGVKLSAKHRESIGQGQIGRHLPEETRKKISEKLMRNKNAKKSC